MPDIATIASEEQVREYAQGAAQSSVQPVADFLAPTVAVGSPLGKYDKYDAKNRFRLPDTRLSPSGRATVIDFSKSREAYDCEPHGLDIPVPIAGTGSDEDIRMALMEAADLGAEIGALAHEKNVIDTALGTLGAGTAVDFGAGKDPIDVIDQYILNTIKAAKYGSLMGVGVLFGATAWRGFKNHASVRGRYVVNTSKFARVGIAQPGINAAGELFVMNCECRSSFMVYDDAAEGLDESIKFLLDNSILVFARSPNPTRKDPSFMKTFRLRNHYMVPGTYSRDDGRAEVAKYDWSEDVKVTNTVAGVRLNPNFG